MSGQDFVTPEMVQERLLQAGRTLMALRVPGCFPAGYRSGMPDTLPQGLAAEFGADYLMRAEVKTRIDPPPAAAIRDMDVAFRWVGRYLPGQTPATIRHRRAILQRSLLHPLTDRHVSSFRSIGARLGISHTYAQTLWDGGMDRIAGGLRRDGALMPPACAVTIARIRGLQAIAKLAHGTVARDLADT